MNRALPFSHKQSESQARGTKRTRPPPSGKRENQNSDNSDPNNEDDDVDVPLSKRINRLNIEYTKQGDDDKETFQDKYPYDQASTYYQSNELLYNLHEQRSQRSQQAALHKALNSHLKL